MNAIACRLLAAAALLGILLVSGCTQMPTEKSAVSDLRPQLSFKVESEALLSSRVRVDGLDVGSVADYLTGKAALRVLSGTHQVQVYSSQGIFLDEKVYVGDGVSRSFLVK